MVLRELVDMRQPLGEELNRARHMLNILAKFCDIANAGRNAGKNGPKRHLLKDFSRIECQHDSILTSIESVDEKPGGKKPMDIAIIF